MKLLACSVLFGWLLIIWPPVTQEAVSIGVEQALENLTLKIPVPKRFRSAEAVRALNAEKKEIAMQATFFDQDSEEWLQLHTETGFDRTINAARRGAAKAYCNSTIEQYSKRGYELVEVSPKELIKEFDSFDFSKEMNVMFTLKGETGELRFVKLRIFFSNLGFFVGVHSNNLERLNSLDEFVKGVVPKAK